MNQKAQKGENLEILLRSPKTVFTAADVALLWHENNRKAINNRLKKYAAAGKLIRVHYGIYAKDTDYNRFELSTRIYTPAYVSFETILTNTGINFQYYGNIFVASYINRQLTIDNQAITLVRMKDYVLSDSTGIDHSAGYAAASPERALLDRLYISKDYHFDNLNNINWEKIFTILPIYQNKRLEKKVNTLFTLSKRSLNK